jgi:hypothetical protein
MFSPYHAFHLFVCAEFIYSKRRSLLMLDDAGICGSV